MWEGEEENPGLKVAISSGKNKVGSNTMTPGQNALFSSYHACISVIRVRVNRKGAIIIDSNFY